MILVLAHLKAHGDVKYPHRVLAHRPPQYYRPCLFRVRWDEETIAEHDKLRGTRQKVGHFPPIEPHRPSTSRITDPPSLTLPGRSLPVLIPSFADIDR